MPVAVGDRVTRSGRTYYAKIRTTFMDVTSASGTFAYGETVTGGTSSATGVVLLYDAAEAEIQVAVLTGTFQNSETLTGGTSAATATSASAPAVAYGTTWNAVESLKQGFQLNRQRSSQDIVTMDSDETDFADKVRGVQSASGSFPISMIPGGTTFQLFEAAMDYDLDMALKRVLTDRDGAHTRTRYYTGGVSGFNENDPVDNESEIALSFDFSDVALADPT